MNKGETASSISLMSLHHRRTKLTLRNYMRMDILMSEVIKMAYIVKARPNGFRICACHTEREARLLISAMESKDVQENTFEPDTYYVEEGEE